MKSTTRTRNLPVGAEHLFPFDFKAHIAILSLMKIASWNINSLKARLDHVKQWLKDQKPDILMVQELKGLDFPAEEFQDLGYQCEAVTQKSYNGVAIFSKNPADIKFTSLPGDENDDQARYIEFDYQGLRLINIYLPNGNPADGPKYEYKLGWMARLYHRLSELRANDIDFAIGGDFNVIPEPHDCYDPKAWADDALFKLETRQAFRKLLNLGLTDAFRVMNNASEQYTFWDYQGGAWPANHGIRIDHFLLSPKIADRLKSCTIDKTPRGWDRPSDHTPIIVEISE